MEDTAAVISFSLVAYIIVRTRTWGRAALDLLSWIPFTLPGIILELGFLWLFLDIPFFRPFYGTLLLVILASTFAGMTLGVQIIKSNMLQLEFDLEEAAWMTGSSRFYAFRRVGLRRVNKKQKNPRDLTKTCDTTKIEGREVKCTTKS